MTQAKQPAPEDSTAAAFIDSPRSVTFNGADVAVLPMELLQSIKLTRILKPLFPTITNFIITGGDDLHGDGGSFDLIANAYADHGEAVIEALELLTGIDAAVIGRTRDLAGITTLLQAIFEVNKDFFGQQVAALLADMRRKTAASGPGLMPSTASPTATH